MTLSFSRLLIALLLLAVTGVVHGMWTHRWSEAAPKDDGQNLLASINEPVGGWSAGEFLKINVNDVPKKTQTASRRFTAEKTGKACVVSVTSGIPGVVAAHTPDVCYGGIGFKPKNPPSKQTLPLEGGGSATFYVADFQKTTSVGQETLRVRWAWTADGTWQAPDYPRLFFAKSQMQLPLLYKLYIVHNLTDDEDLTKSDPYRKFATDLAAALGRTLQH